MNKIAEGYKQTEVGVIPGDWVIKSLGDVVDFLDGQRRPIKDSDRAKMSGQYPYYGASGVIDFVNDYIFDEELILLGEDGENILSRNLRLAFKIIGKVWVNNHAHVLKPKEKFDINYVTEKLESINYEQYNTGTAQPKLNQKTCLIIPIAFPPTKAEQTAIATVLNDADALITQLEKLIAKKRNIKQGAMQELLRPKEGWVVKKLGEIGSFKGGSGFPVKTQGQKDERIPFYKVSDMNLIGNEIFMSNSNNWISEHTVKHIGAYCFPLNTIVFAKIGAAIYLERKKILSMVSCIDNNMMGFIVNSEDYVLKFIYFLFHTMKIGSYANTTALPSINGKDLSDIEIKIPLSKEQTRIAQILSDMDAEIDALEKKLEKYKMLKQGMMQELLTGKTRLV